MTSLNTTGIRELDRVLDKLEPKLRNQALRKATREVAKVSQSLAKQDAPHETGQLEQSLKVRTAKKKDLSRALNTSYRSLRTIVGHTVETGEAFYAVMVEFGTRQRRTRSGANRGRIPANTYSFLRPALWRFPDRKRRIFIHRIAEWIRAQGGKV